VCHSPVPLLKPSVSWKMGTLNREWGILETCAAGEILEVSFRGEHDWTHGKEMEECLSSALADCPGAVAFVFNLLEYRYVFGNDVSCFLTAAYDRTRKRKRPVAVIATGTTHCSLRNLYESGKLLTVFPIEFFSTVADGLEFVKAHLDGDSP
jgi:hypothetical protein